MSTDSTDDIVASIIASTDNTVAVIAWANDCWEYLDDYNLADYAFMSDDTFVLYLPADVDEDQIEEYVRAFNRGDIAGYVYVN